MAECASGVFVECDTERERTERRKPKSCQFNCTFKFTFEGLLVGEQQTTTVSLKLTIRLRKAWQGRNVKLPKGCQSNVNFVTQSLFLSVLFYLTINCS